MDIFALLSFALTHQASDLHLSAGMPAMIRVDGLMQRVDGPILRHQELVDNVYELMGETLRKEFEHNLEVDFIFAPANSARFRVHVFNQFRGIAVAIRVVPTEILTIKQLQLPLILEQFARLSSGLVLVAGPTGSGKTTTLAAMVDSINCTYFKHIITIEDPIEFVHQSKQSLIQQREVGAATLSFEKALRAALREDPDVLLIGELRDLPSIRMALTAAETGHLVLGTLHAHSASNAINRLIGVFPASEQSLIRTMLSESLQAIVTQNLLKKVVKGRVAACEILIATPAVRNLIREDKMAQIYSAIQSGQAKGMQTMEQHVQQLVKKQTILEAAVES